MYRQIHCSNSCPILELSVKFASQICHENINKPLDGAYLADFGIDISNKYNDLLWCIVLCAWNRSMYVNCTRPELWTKSPKLLRISAIWWDQLDRCHRQTPKQYCKTCKKQNIFIFVVWHFFFYFRDRTVRTVGERENLLKISLNDDSISAIWWAQLKVS